MDGCSVRFYCSKATLNIYSDKGCVFRKWEYGFSTSRGGGQDKPYWIIDVRCFSGPDGPIFEVGKSYDLGELERLGALGSDTCRLEGGSV